MASFDLERSRQDRCEHVCHLDERSFSRKRSPLGVTVDLNPAACTGNLLPEDSLRRGTDELQQTRRCSCDLFGELGVSTGPGNIDFRSGCVVAISGMADRYGAEDSSSARSAFVSVRDEVMMRFATSSNS